jgi:mono/diheme cytochrome c family protein
MIFGDRLQKAWILGAAITLGGHAALAQTGPFTQAQVTTGHKNFVGYCSACHGQDLAGGGDAPPLGGAFFSGDWAKYSVSQLYAFVSNAMPEGLEGELKPEEYSSIIAYLLAANGAKPGPAPFTGKSDVKIGDIITGRIVPSVVNAATE